VLERGKVTRIDVPEARLTVPHGINDRGQVVGEYTDANGMDRGFLWTRGRVTTFAVADATFTKPNAFNDRGEIVGIYGDTDGAIHGFHLRHGRTTTLDAPGATATIPYDVNDRGQIVVSAFTPTADDPFAAARGFVLRDGIEGPFTEARFPGAPRTVATGIDDRGRIVGVYENPNYQSHSATPRPQLGLLSISGRQRGGCSG
jgi:probable HAF family extracellular repeat protein